MREKKEKKQTAKYQLILTVFLLLVCVTSIVGAAWARYWSQDFAYLNYGIREPDTISLWGWYDPLSGELSGKSEWQISDGMGILDFYISNGTVSRYAEKDKEVSVRLHTSLSAHEAEVWLTIEETRWEGEAVDIVEGTALEKSFGPGKVYIFRDESGKELNWNLDGGELSVLEAQFYVTGLEEQGDTSKLFQVLVTEEIS